MDDINFAAIFNYFEAGLWLSIAITIFFRRKNLPAELVKLANILCVSFVLFCFSDIVEASTGAWWRPLWLLALKALCILSFIYCWIKYHKIKTLAEE